MENFELKQKLIKGFGNDTFLKLKMREELNGLTKFSINKYMPFSLLSTAYLEGNYSEQLGQKLVTIKVRPSLYHPIFVIGVIVFLLRQLYLVFSDRQDLSTTIFVCFFCIVAFIINYILALGFSNNLKDNLQDVLALKL